MVQRSPNILLVLFLCSACLVLQAASLVDWPKNISTAAPVTSWLLTPQISDTDGITGIPMKDRAAWQRVGAKLWYFLTHFDHDYVDAKGTTVPPSIGVRRKFGPSVTCGRYARQWMRLAFHDCGTFDVGNTGSEGDNGKPRFGCNGSLRKELAPCPGGPGCWKGAERAYDLKTGDWKNQTAFASLEAKYPGQVDWAIDPDNARMESTGFAMSLVMLEARHEQSDTLRLPGLTFADTLIYAAMLGVAKCGGPQVEFQPGRVDADHADGPFRLPESTENLPEITSYFWANGVTNFDMVNLLAVHSTACFSVGCMDTTPSRFDADWAKGLLSVRGASDPRICQLDEDGRPLRKAINMCVLPSDAELAAREDTRAYLYALTTNNSTDLRVPASNPAVPFNPVPSCPLRQKCTARPASWTPFRVISGANMCNRGMATKVGCENNAVQKNLNDAVATSFFKMSKWFGLTAKDGTIVSQGQRWGVKPQPCQPGLIKIGMAEDGPSTVCSCCSKAMQQNFFHQSPGKRKGPARRRAAPPGRSGDGPDAAKEPVGGATKAVGPFIDADAYKAV